MHQASRTHRGICCAAHLAIAALSAATAATAALFWSLPAYAQSTIQPAGPAWTVQPKFEKNADARKALSGAACAPISPPVCLAANDEKKYAQFFSIQSQTLVPDDLIRLVLDSENGIAFDELDIEAVAYSDGFFYLAGSHGAPRKTNKPIDPSRFFIYRFNVNAQTGKPDFPFSDDHVEKDAIEKRNTLRELIKTTPEFAPFAEKPLNEANGANIEGIAVTAGRMFLGFRGPSVEGQAFILSVDTNGLFGTAALNPKVHPVALGDKIGIRDLAPVKDGLLVLSGPAGDTSGTYAISQWNDKTEALTPIAVLGGIPAGGKPETVIVLDEEPDHYRVLILIESIENGNPLEYRFQRPKSSSPSR
jgi:Protein of unknown function (DUF3616)